MQPRLAGASRRAPGAAARALDALVPALPILAVGCAIAGATPSYGPAALQTRLAHTILAHGVPGGAASLGWLGALALGAASADVAWASVFITAACAAVALVLVDARERALAPGPGAARGLAVSLAALCALDALHPGAGAGAWCFTALAMLLLDAPSRPNVAAFAALTLVWCNLEPEGLLAPCLAGAVALGAALDGSGSARRLRWATVALAALATFCTPAGLGFPRAALDALRLSNATAGIVAIVPAVTAPHAYRLGLFALLVLGLAAGTRERGLRGALPVALTFVLALANGAFVPVFGIVAAPLVVSGLRTLRFRVPRALPLALASAVLLAAALVARDSPEPGLAAAPFELATRHAAGASPQARLFCAHLDWCDPAFAGGERVLMDGDLATSSADERATQRTIVAVGAGWEHALARSGTNAVLAQTGSSLATLLGLSGSWRLVASGPEATLFERRAR